MKYLVLLVCWKILANDSSSNLAQILSEFELNLLNVKVNFIEVSRQGKFRNKIEFKAAFKEALNVLLNDEIHPETPLNIVKDISDPGNYKEKLKEFLNDQSSFIRHLALEESPENGEKVQKNWIFHLKIPKLSDHLYWVVIERQKRRKGYIYGFN